MKYRRDKQSKPIPVLLDKALRDRITAVSEKMGEPKSTVMRIAMRIGLEGLDKVFEQAPTTAEETRKYSKHVEKGFAVNEQEPNSPAKKEGTAESFLDKVAEDLSARAKRGAARQKPRQ